MDVRRTNSELYYVAGRADSSDNTYVNDELSDLYPWLPLYYSIYQYTKPVIPPKLLNNKVIPQWEIDEVVCKWLYKLLDSEIEVRETISETQKALQILAKQYQ